MKYHLILEITSPYDTYILVFPKASSKIFSDHLENIDKYTLLEIKDISHNVFDQLRYTYSDNILNILYNLQDEEDIKNLSLGEISTIRDVLEAMEDILNDRMAFIFSCFIKFLENIFKDEFLTCSINIDLIEESKIDNYLREVESDIQVKVMKLWK